MDEQHWNTCTDPHEMLRWLNPNNARISKIGKVVDTSHLWTDRKLRLIGCAVCRLVWDELTDPRSRLAVANTELFADGEITPEEMLKVAELADEKGREEGNFSVPWWSAVTIATTETPIDEAIRQALDYSTPEEDREKPRPQQCAVIREIKGNPFHNLSLCGKGNLKGTDPTGQFCPHCKVLRTRDVMNIAKLAYESRDFSGLPYLADALEDAGCVNRDVLLHLRGLKRCQTCIKKPDEKNHPVGMIFVGWGRGWEPCPDCGGSGVVPANTLHFRGCWVLDLILNKE